MRLRAAPSRRSVAPRTHTHKMPKKAAAKKRAAPAAAAGGGGKVQRAAGGKKVGTSAGAGPPVDALEFNKVLKSQTPAIDAFILLASPLHPH